MSGDYIVNPVTGRKIKVGGPAWKKLNSDGVFSQHEHVEKVVPTRIMATWNINSLKARMDNVIAWIKLNRPMLLALQEIRADDEKINWNRFKQLGYDSHFYCKGGRNGVAILVHETSQVKNVKKGLENEPTFEGNTEHRAISLEIDIDGVFHTVYSVYVPNGRAIDNPHFQYKLAWLECLGENVKKLPHVILMGDMNVAPRDEDVHNIGAFTGCTHVTEQERRAIREMGLKDFIPYGLENGQRKSHFTYWTYLAGCFWKDKGMRIDLVLSNSENIKETYADRDPRALKGASDHTPLVIILKDCEI